MDDHASIDEQSALRVQLELHLDHQPISGRLRTERGAEEQFVGWLGFAGAVEQLRQRQARSVEQPGDQAGALAMRQRQTERS